MIDSLDIRVDTATGAGTTTSTLVVQGEILCVYLNYHADADAGTDVTVKTATSPQITILSKSDSNTDAWFSPRAQANLNTDGSSITNSFVPIGVSDKIVVTVAQEGGTHTDAVIATIWYRR